MRHPYLFSLAAAGLMLAASLQAEVGTPPPQADMRSKRASEMMAMPLVSPEANPFFQTMQPFSTNGLDVAGRMKAMRAQEEEGTEDPVIYGVVIAASQYTQYGIKQIPLREGDDFKPVQGAGAYFSQVTSGTETDGILYTNNLVSRYGSLYCSYYSALDINNNWNRVAYSQSSDMIYSGRDMATDPITGDMYGCLIKTGSGASYVLARVEYNYGPSGQFTEMKREGICDLPNLLTALFFTADGQLWGIDMVTEIDEESTASDKAYTKSASLYKIDKHTGEMTLVGDTGVKPYYVTSACCDLYGSGKVYWSVKTKENVGSLYTVDLTTGAATKVMDYPRNEEVVAMFVPIQASGKAPAEPKDVVADFPEGGLEGNIRFTIPDVLNDSTAAEGECDWIVVNNGTVVGEGKAAYGSQVACPFTAQQPGTYNFSVRLVNDAGKGKRVNISQYIGFGVPDTPKVNAAYVNGRIVIAWEPITHAYGDRGYVDFDKITYEVTRYPDNAIVSSGKNATSYIEEVPADAEFGYYTYGVKAVAGDARSGEGKSNMLILGTITPPYTETFDDTSLIGYGDNILNGVYPDYELDGSTLGHWYVHAAEKAATCSTGFGDENAWLMTPGFKFEAGKSYTLSFDTWTGYKASKDSKISRLKVMMGKGQNPDAMTDSLFGEFTVTNLKADKAFMIKDFTVAQSGVYYIGINCCTKDGGVQVYLDNMTVQESPEPGIPGPCSAISVKAEATGSLNTIITATTPVKDTRNNALTGQLKVDLLYDGKVVMSQNNVAPGTELTFNHTVDKGGDIRYTIVASNDKGSGKAVTAGCYVGFYPPRQAMDVKLTRLDDTKKFKVEWTAPTQDTKWNALTASDITYKVLGVNKEGETYTAVDNISGETTSVEFSDPTVDFAGEQRFVYYGVVACTNGGVSGVTPTNVLPVGKPYAAPYKESFAGEPAGIYSADNGSPLGTWYNLNDSNIDIVKAQDGDNGYLGYFASMWNTQGVFQTGLIDLSGLDTPGISFYVFNVYQNETFDDNTIMVAVNLGGPISYMVKAEPDVVGNLGKANCWAKYSVSLSQFKGRTVSLMIAPATMGIVWSFIDNISVDNLPATDISAGPIAGSPLIEEGQDGLYVFNIINNGYNTAENFSVDLVRNGKSVKTEAVSKLRPGQLIQLQMLDKPDVDADETAYYKARVSAPGDADTSDNESDSIATRIVLPPYPTVETIDGKMMTDGAEIEWQAPELKYVPNQRTETFETASAWAKEYGEWTFIDRDEKPINLGTGNGAFGEDFVTGSNQSFIVVDVSQFDEQRQNSVHFAAHSGLHYLVKCAPGDVNAAGDDWAISPELYGEAQTVTLWAHSHSASSPENIEGLYSTGSLDPADFISISKHIDVPQGWTMYSFDLPAGAKRFAIRANSQATFLLQIDDVTYQPMPLDLELKGYHVWRNGARVTTEPVDALTYLDKEGKMGDTYRISPVYTIGEGVPGQMLTINRSGVDGVNADSIRVYGEAGAIIVAGAEGSDINVYTAEGALYRSVKGLFSNVIPAAPGIYIVKAGASVAKVVVK